MRQLIRLVEGSETLPYWDAVHMVADDDELYEAIVAYVRNFEGGVAANPALAARFAGIIARTPAEKWHVPLWRGEGAYRGADHGRAFHSWSISPQVARTFAQEYGRDGILLKLDAPVRSMALEDIFRLRHRLRPDESPSGQQGEIFVLDSDIGDAERVVLS